MENQTKNNPEGENQKDKKQDEKKHGISPEELDAITGSATEHVKSRTHPTDHWPIQVLTYLMKDLHLPHPLAQVTTPASLLQAPALAATTTLKKNV